MGITFEQREYQSRFIKWIVDFVNSKSKARAAYAVAPTGAGKSWIIAEAARQLGKKTLVLQPSEILVTQNLERAEAFGLAPSVYCAGLKRKEWGSYTYGSIQSVMKNLDELREQKFEVIILDECHQWSKTKNSKGDPSSLGKVLAAAKAKWVIGVTATPFTVSNNYGVSTLKMLHRDTGNIFTKLLGVIQIKEIADKYWSKLEYENHPFTVSRQSLPMNTTGNEFKLEDSTSYVKNQREYNTKIFRRMVELINSGKSKNILYFADSTDTAQKMAGFLRTEAGITAEYLGHHSKNKDRPGILNRFKTGETKVICQVKILGIGFDFPELDTVVLGRPIGSLTDYYQFVGRAVRTGTKSALIVDFGDNVSTFGKVEDLTYLPHTELGDLFVSNNIALTQYPLRGQYTLEECVEMGKSQFTFRGYRATNIASASMKELSNILRLNSVNDPALEAVQYQIIDHIKRNLPPNLRGYYLK